MEPVEAAAAVARAHGLQVETPRVLKDAHNLVVHLAPAPVVARVSTRTSELREGDRRRELELTVWLLERGLPVTPPAAELPVRVHEHGGLEMTFWRLLPDDGEPDPVEAGRRLRAIDEALRDYDGDAVAFWPLDETRDLVARLDLPPLVAETIDRVGAALDGDRVLVHGDAHRGNCFAGPLWGDLEDACVAPPEWEHACLQLPVELDGDAWHATVLAQLPPPDRARLELLVRLRCAVTIAWGTFVHGPTPRIAQRLAWLEARS